MSKHSKRETFGGFRWIVPEISRFLGIVIKMFYRGHEPAHFHAVLRFMGSIGLWYIYGPGLLKGTSHDGPWGISSNGINSIGLLWRRTGNWLRSESRLS